jgi:hypothetical protein
MKKKHRTPWRWTGSNLLLDGDDEKLWLCPDLPPLRERSSHPLAVAINYWFAETPEFAGMPTLNEALFALWRAFGHDSMLVAVHRRGIVNALLIYTAAPKDVADRRYYAIRQALRPPISGVRFIEEPQWDALTELMSSVKNGSVQDLLR